MRFTLVSAMARTLSRIDVTENLQFGPACTGYHEQGTRLRPAENRRLVSLKSRLGTSSCASEPTYRARSHRGGAGVRLHAGVRGFTARADADRAALGNWNPCDFIRPGNFVEGIFHV